MSLDATIQRGGYGRTNVIDQVIITVNPGEIVALLGANGAGKSTVLRIIAGLLPLDSGTVVVDGVDLTRSPAETRPRHGIAHVPEGRQLFPQLSVNDNLELGAFANRPAMSEMLMSVFELFPVLHERRKQRAGSLSGGQAQMLAVGRALMCKPRYVLMDEPSLGLAPMLVHRVFNSVRQLAQADVGVLVAEQNANIALAAADRAYVLERGRVSLTGTGSELLGDKRIVDSFLGGSAD